MTQYYYTLGGTLIEIEGQWVYSDINDQIISFGAKYHNTVYSDSSTGVWGWGLNDYGQTGDNSIINKSTPTSVYGNHTFCYVTVGDSHIFAIDYDNIIWAWGSSLNGELGNNGVVSYSTPIVIFENTRTFCTIKAGVNNTFAIDYNGQAWGWGYAYDGELGNNDTIDKSTPVAVCGNHTFCKIDNGYYQTMAIDNKGNGWGWGWNYHGSIGDNTVNDRSTPVAICGVHTFCEISCGLYFNVSIDKDGQAWSWGYNVNGQLGNNTILSSVLTPVSVYGVHTFCQISCGYYFSLAIDKDGKLWGWGNNNLGSLGDNTTSSRITPVEVCGNHTFCQISAGNFHSMALDNNNQLWGWGYNNYGQLGDNTIVNKSTPILITI